MTISAKSPETSRQLYDGNAMKAEFRPMSNVVCQVEQLKDLGGKDKQISAAQNWTQCGRKKPHIELIKKRPWRSNDAIA